MWVNGPVQNYSAVLSSGTVFGVKRALLTPCLEGAVTRVWSFLCLPAISSPDGYTALSDVRCPCDRWGTLALVYRSEVLEIGIPRHLLATRVSPMPARVGPDAAFSRHTRLEGMPDLSFSPLTRLSLGSRMAQRRRARPRLGRRSALVRLLRSPALLPAHASFPARLYLGRFLTDKETLACGSPPHLRERKGQLMSGASSGRDPAEPDDHHPPPGAHARARWVRRGCAFCLASFL